MSDWNAGIINDFRTRNGEAGNFGRRLVLLTTTGAKSGAQRTSPMMWFPGDDTTIYVIASKGGAPEHPAWYHNLVKHPEVHVEQATESGVDEYVATGSVMSREDRDRVYAEFAKEAPGFGDYEKKTSRVIPIVALTRK